MSDLQGVIHRDIKSENILLMSDGTVKLADFGLSINHREERPVTRAGTLDMMAPEVRLPPTAECKGGESSKGSTCQAVLQVLVCPEKSRPEENKERAMLEYTEAVDSWAIGIVTFELLVGHPPFERESRSETYEHIMYRAPVMPPSIGQAAKSFITSALVKARSLLLGGAPPQEEKGVPAWVLLVPPGCQQAALGGAAVDPQLAAQPQAATGGTSTGCAALQEDGAWGGKCEHHHRLHDREEQRLERRQQCQLFWLHRGRSLHETATFVGGQIGFRLLRGVEPHCRAPGPAVERTCCRGESAVGPPVGGVVAQDDHKEAAKTSGYHFCRSSGAAATKAASEFDLEGSLATSHTTARSGAQATPPADLGARARH